jgi:hypothetical protein
MHLVPFHTIHQTSNLEGIQYNFKHLSLNSGKPNDQGQQRAVSSLDFEQY